MSDLIKLTCTQCGQHDDHPKVHVGNTDDQYHHDCLPYHLREQVMAHPQGAAVIAACEGGLKGDELRDHIINVIHGGGE